MGLRFWDALIFIFVGRKIIYKMTTSKKQITTKRQTAPKTIVSYQVFKAALLKQTHKASLLCSSSQLCSVLASFSSFF